jgi:prepilin-type processing-associated H-X9-DG protein
MCATVCSLRGLRIGVAEAVIERGMRYSDSHMLYCTQVSMLGGLVNEPNARCRLVKRVLARYSMNLNTLGHKPMYHPMIDVASCHPMMVTPFRDGGSGVAWQDGHVGV